MFYTVGNVRGPEKILHEVYKFYSRVLNQLKINLESSLENQYNK